MFSFWNSIQALLNPDPSDDEILSEIELANAVKKPHLWLTSAVMGSISLAFFGALGWAAFSKVDQVAVAPGSLVPSAEVQPIRAQVGGELQAINVSEGQQVKAGDELVRVNSKINEANLQSLRGEMPANTIANQAVKARLEEYQANIEQQQSIVDENQALLNGVGQNLSHAREKLRRLDGLCTAGALPRLDCLDARDRIVSLQSEVAAKRQHVVQAQQRLRQLKAAPKSEILALTYEGIIESPLEGTVYNVKVNESGAAVQAGDEILSILPNNQELILKAKLLNQDKGFVYTGMKVKIKLTSFPYQEYGTLEGVVKQISPNSVEDKELGSYFPIQIQLQQTSIEAEDEIKPLVPGMEARAELIIRRRSILTTLLEPILVNWDNAFSSH